MTLSTASATTGISNLPPLLPGASGWRGHAGLFFADTIALLARLAEEYPKVVRLRFGPSYMWIVNDADLTHDVLVTNQKSYRRPGAFSSILKQITPESLFVSEGDVWLRQRRALQPSFHRRRVADFGEIMAHEAQAAADRLLATNSAHTDVQAEMVRTALNIVGRSLFSVDMHATSQGSRLSGAFSSISEWINYRFQNFLAPPTWVPTRTNRSFVQARREMRTVVHEVIERRRRSESEQHDFLQMLMDLRYDDGSAMTDEQIVYEAASFFFAGHETTANTLSWAWWLLAVNPEQEARLHDELATVLQGSAPTIADLTNLPYTRHVIDETLRLYPPAWSTSRQALAHRSLGDWALPRRDQLFLNIVGMQRATRYFADPLRFLPERFLQGPPAFTGAAYMPFGAGPRLCIGMQFALYEAQMVLATLAQQLRMRPAPGYVAEHQTLFTLRVKDQLRLVVTPRA